MNGADEYAVAQGNTRLIPNLNTTCKMEVPGDLPGVVIFLHGVNDPGASYSMVESGLCQGVNERLDRPDLVPGRYGAEYDIAKKNSEPNNNWKIKINSYSTTQTPIFTDVILTTRKRAAC
jgi:hypothetical protein